MKAAAFFIGFMLVFIGAGVKPEASIIWSLALITPGLGMMWWGVLPRKGNCFKR